MLLSYRNQSIDLQCKLIEWFLCECSVDSRSHSLMNCELIMVREKKAQVKYICLLVSWEFSHIY